VSIARVQSSTACLSHHEQHDARGWSDAFCLECERDRNPRWCAKSNTDDIREIPSGCGGCKDPDGNKMGRVREE